MYRGQNCAALSNFDLKFNSRRYTLDLTRSDDLELSESESDHGIAGISDPFSEEGASNTPGVSGKSSSAEVVSKTSNEKTDEVRRSYKAEARAKVGRRCNPKS